MNSNELRQTGISINNILSRYIQIHDALFKFSLKKFLPIPFMFKKIDYESLYLDIAEILKDLTEIKLKLTEAKLLDKKNQEVYGTIIPYVENFRQTVQLLSYITLSLSKKINDPKSYQFSKYQKSIAEYNELRNLHNKMGQNLNIVFNKIT